MDFARQLLWKWRILVLDTFKMFVVRLRDIYANFYEYINFAILNRAFLRGFYI